MEKITFEFNNLHEELIKKKAYSVLPRFLNPFVPVIRPKVNSPTVVIPKFSLDNNDIFTTEQAKEYENDDDSDYEANENDDIKDLEVLDQIPTVSNQLKQLTSYFH